MKFYYVSLTKLTGGQTIKPYGRSDNFRAMFDFCLSLIEKGPDKIPLVFLFEEFVSVKGISCPNRYSMGSMMREVLAEQVRQSHFADKPSRIESVFLFEDYKDACRFLMNYRKNGRIYRCESKAQNVFTGDMAIITHARLAHNEFKNGFQPFKDAMIRYWEGNGPMEYPETICKDPVTVIEPV